MQIEVKDGIIYIPIDIWKKARLPKDGGYEVEVKRNQIIISAQPKTRDKGRPGSLRELGFVGMWADRRDMSDSREWLRKQRAGWRKRAKASG